MKRITVTTYDGGRPTEHPAAVETRVAYAKHRVIQITPKGRDYLAALRAEGASVAP